MPEQPEHRLTEPEKLLADMQEVRRLLLTEQEKLLTDMQEVRRLLEAALARLPPDPAAEVRTLAAIGTHSKLWGPKTDKEAFGR